MSEEKTAIDIGRVVDEQKIGVFNISLLVFAALASVVDGYDIFVPGFIAPELIKAWGVSPGDLGSMFGIGMIGIIIGAPLFGWFGDRYGRKRAIVLGSLLYGVVSLGSLAATSIGQFTALRFLIGLGLGGVIPNALALVSEFTPIRYRASFMMLVVLGVPIGQLLPGFVTAAFVPQYGWKILLVVGGIGPILVAVLVQFVLPESIKYLVLRTSRFAEVKRLQAMQPAIPLMENSRFIIPEPLIAAKISPAKLFSDGLALITPLVWICLSMALLAVYFTASWLPAVLQAAGLTTQQAALRAVYFGAGGVFGALCFTLFVHRLGVAAVALGFIISVPLVVCIGISGLSTTLISALTAGAGFCIFGIINGMESIMGTLYPTAIRSKGIGWGLGVGRLGSTAGPVLGGYLVGMKFTNFQLFLAPAAFLLVGSALFVVLAALCVRRFHGMQLNDEVAIHGATVMGTVGE